MFGEITVNKIVEVTDKELTEALNSMQQAYMIIDTAYKQTNNKMLGDMLVYIAHSYDKISEWQKYYNQFNTILTNKVESNNEEVLRLREEVKLLNKEIERLNKLKDEPMDNKLKLLGEATDLIKEAKASVEHKAAMKTFNGRVASGEVKPAKRADVSDDYIVEKYNEGATAYKIAQSVGMTQAAILYRIKKLKENGILS